MPMRGEMQPVPPRSQARAAKIQSAWSIFVTAMSNPDLQCTALFCAIGLLATINLMLHIPTH
jgi:hypothetical protein